jgi:glutamate-1-semialdehyde 2,1-aminomutase
MKSHRYEESENHLKRAERTIPLGSQTFSKSRTQYPVGISPLYIDRARGCYVWDVDGNKYIDLVSSLASVTIGYGDKGILSAVNSQMKKGVTFSLPGVLEAEVAELICHLVPSAEMVRFGKNGSDATSAAVRLARAYTSRDHVVVCGYHGWQDWYIGSTSRNKGVPAAVSDLTHSFAYNDLAELKALLENNSNISCVVMEPMNSVYPAKGFLEGVRELTKIHGVVLIFDETITGFRFAKGGAQELFGVTPDLSTFGKGIANGFPLSAVVGKREIMMEMEEIFFSGTFGGELLSLAAAKTVLTSLENFDFTQILADQGEKLTAKAEDIISAYTFQDALHFTGHPSWRFLNWKNKEGFSDIELKTFFLQSMFSEGLLMLSTHNLNLAHSDRVIEKIARKYEKTIDKITSEVRHGTLREKLKAKPLESIFRVR